MIALGKEESQVKFHEFILEELLVQNLVKKGIKSKDITLIVLRASYCHKNEKVMKTLEKIFEVFVNQKKAQKMSEADLKTLERVKKVDFDGNEKFEQIVDYLINNKN